MALMTRGNTGTEKKTPDTCDSTALNLKRRFAADLVEFSGLNGIRHLLDGIRPGWEPDLRMVRQRHLCNAASGCGQLAAGQERR